MSENAASALANAIPDATIDSIDKSPIAPMAQAEPELPMNMGHLESTPVIEETEQKRTTTRRGKAPTAPRSTALPKELKGIVPSSDRVHIYKRDVNGKMAYAADYSSQEVAGCGTIEAFLKKYAVPKWGYGEFHLHVQKSGGPLVPMGQVSIAEPISKEKTSEIGSIKELIEAQKKMEQDASRENASAFDGMARMMETISRMKESNGSGDMMPLMLMMMQQQQQSASRGPKSDPIIEVVLRRLEAMESKVSAPPPMPPMPPMAPPPPPVDPMASMAPILASMLESNAQMNRMMMEIASRPAPVAPMPPQRDVLAEMAHMKNIFGSNENSLGAKDIIGLLPMVKDLLQSGNNGQLTLEDQIAEFRHMKEGLGELEREFRPASTNTGGFWDKAADILGGLISQGNMGQQIAESISPPPQQAQQVRPKIEANASAPEPEVQKFKMPEGFEKYAQQVNEGESIGHKIGAFVMGMQFLVRYDEFKAPIMSIFTAIQKNDRENALKMLDGFLSAFMENEIFTEEAAVELFEGVQVHWDMIRHKMGVGPAPAAKVTVTPPPTEGEPEVIDVPEVVEEANADAQEAVETEDDDEDDEITESEAALITKEMNGQDEAVAQA
jgi:hypothetical protein